MSKFASDLASAVKEDLFKSGIFGGIGNVYIVCRTANTAAFAELNRKFGGLTYDDGSAILYPATTAAADLAINAALSSCVLHRGDYVVLMPDDGNYTLTATIAMSKKGVHLIGLGNMANLGCMNLCRLDARGKAFHAITTSSGGIEIAGIYINTATDYYGIYCTDGSVSGYGLNIHHNRVHVYTSATGTGGGIVCSGAAAGGYSNFDSNVILVGTGAASAAVAGISVPNGTFPVITNNYVMAQNGCTVAIGINASGTGGLVAYNIIHERAVEGASTAGVFTLGINLSTSALAVGNRIGIAITGSSFGGGTASVGFVLNYDSTTNGGTLLNG